jgi:hypothetical protein
MDTHEKMGEKGYHIREEHGLGKKKTIPRPEKQENRKSLRDGKIKRK